jgi:hypothetical protein
LRNHVQDLVSVDFFTVPIVSFRALFVWAGMAAPQAADYSIVHPVPNKSIHDGFLSETKESRGCWPKWVSTTDRALAMRSSGVCNDVTVVPGDERIQIVTSLQ